MALAARVVLVVMLLAALVGPAPAGSDGTGQEPPPPASPPGPAAPGSSPIPLPAKEDPLEEFVPHERVPADSVVAFPADI